jgi:hypothetical protein
MAIDEAFLDVGLPVPSIIARRCLARLANGETRQGLAACLSISDSTVSNILNFPGLTLRLDVLERLIERLGLSPEEAEHERRRSEQVKRDGRTKASESMHAGIKVGRINAPGSSYFREQWTLHPKKARRRQNKAIEKSRERFIEIDRDWLADRRAEGLTFQQIAELPEAHGASWGIVRDRAIGHGLHPGETARDRRQRTRQENRQQDQKRPLEKHNEDAATAARSLVEAALASVLARQERRGHFVDAVTKETARLDPTGKGCSKVTVRKYLVPPS